MLRKILFVFALYLFWYLFDWFT